MSEREGGSKGMSLSEGGRERGKIGMGKDCERDNAMKNQ